MRTDDKESRSLLENFEMVKVLNNVDTRGAVVAAAVISICTFLANCFVELCAYLYWTAYFDLFRIPKEFFSQAIISNADIKYRLIIVIPLAIILWKLLAIADKGIGSLLRKLVRRPFRLWKTRTGGYIIGIGLMALINLFGFALWILALEAEFSMWGLLPLFELYTYALYRVCKSISRRYVDEKKYIRIRVAWAIVAIYVILASVFFAGQLQNYNADGWQMMRIIAPANNQKFAEGDTVEVILFETEDFYYVVDAEYRDYSSQAGLTFYDLSTYCLVDKADCTVSNKFIEYVTVIGGRSKGWYERVDMNFVMAFGLCLVVILYNICILRLTREKQDVLP